MGLPANEHHLQSLFTASIDKKTISRCNLIRHEQLAGDASTRSYYRFFTDRGNYIVCHDPLLKETDSPRVLIVHELLAQNKISIPKFHDVEKSDNYILQEDLGDITLLRTLASITGPQDEYGWFKKSVDALIKLHSIDMTKHTQACFYRESFDAEKLMWEVDFTIRHFIRGYLNYDLSSQDEKSLRAVFAKLCKKLATAPMLLCHRDFHARNIMVKNKKLFLIDFQDARRGIPQYDLVSLLEDCYYRCHPETTKKIQLYYWEKFLKKKKFYKNYAEYLHYYDLMAIQRIFKAIGSFGFFVTEKQNPRYLKYIGYSFENLKSFLLKVPSFNQTRKLLSRIYYAH